MIASSGEEIDFGSTRFLQAVQQPVYLVNNGSNELNIDSIYVEANVGFSASIGGLLLQVGSSLTGGKTIRSIPTVANPGRGNVEEDGLPAQISEKDHSNDIFSVSREGYILTPGDSLEITISFTSADTGSFTTNLIVQSDDPVSNILPIPLLAHSVSPEISLIRTMSVVTYVNNDIAFDVAVHLSLIHI